MEENQITTSRARLTYVRPECIVDKIPSQSLLETISLQGNLISYDSVDGLIESEDDEQP